ncbi:MAG: DUF3198 domain-containing protein [Methanomassiliicoccales archaeon]
MSKPITVERAPELSLGMTALSVLIILISAMGMGYPESYTLGMGDFLLLGLGILLLIVGVGWFMDYRKRVNRFHEYLKEKKKANFIKNLDEIEYLAWRLPSDFEVVLEERKKELKVNR